MKKLALAAEKTFRRLVRPEDCAAFDSGLVHPLYATFALARDAEWCCRLFVLDLKEDQEEGIGTFLEIEHISPARQGETVEFTARADRLEDRELQCTFEARVQGRLVARGRQRQRILPLEKIRTLYRRDV